MSLIYKHEAQGHEAPKGGVLINQRQPSRRYYNLQIIMQGCGMHLRLTHAVMNNQHYESIHNNYIRNLN